MLRSTPHSRLSNNSKPKVNLEPYKEAVNDTAKTARGLWLGFIALETYLAISVGAVTHADLFLENPVKLPILNVDLPLVSFFFTAPVFLLINHFYCLFILAGLARRVGEFNEAVLAAQITTFEENTLRRTLDGFVIVQMIGSPDYERTGVIFLMMRLIVAATLIAVPILLLLLIQIQFLAYHLEWVTNIHRLCLILDAVILCLFWPMIRDGAASLGNRWWSWHTLRVGCSCLLLVIFSVFVATIPGEQTDKYWTQWSPKSWLFEGSVNDVTGKRTSWFSRTLILPDSDFVDDEQLAKLRELERKEQPQGRIRMLSLRGRDLRGAVLSRSDLRYADFSGAQLSNAQLDYAHLDGSQFECGTITNLEGQCARFIDASLIGASIRGASFDGALLVGATLDLASLQGTSFKHALLQGASLIDASLQGSHFEGALLHGAAFDRANLQAVSFDGAVLEAASIKDAKLQGATFLGASLKGASLHRARLQGAQFKTADLTLTELDSAFVWRTLGISDLTTASFRKLNHEPAPDVILNIIPGKFSTLSYKDAEKLSLMGVTDEPTRDLIVSRLSSLRESKSRQSDKSQTNSNWLEGKESARDANTYQKQLAEYLQELACLRTPRPYLAQGIIRNGRLRASGKYAKSTAIAMIKGGSESCPGAVEIDGKSLQLLYKIAEIDPAIHGKSFARSVGAKPILIVQRNSIHVELLPKFDTENGSSGVFITKDRRNKTRIIDPYMGQMNDRLPVIKNFVLNEYTTDDLLTYYDEKNGEYVKLDMVLYDIEFDKFGNIFELKRITIDDEFKRVK